MALTITQALRRIAVYMRVSTDDQTTDSQELELRAFLTREGIDPDRVSWFRDTISSQADRSKWVEFQKMQEMVERGLIDRVVVYHLDRVARRTIDGFNIVMDWVQINIKLSVVAINIDFSGAMGPALAALFFNLAEIDYKWRRERQAAGIAVAKAKGKYKMSRRSKPKRPRYNKRIRDQIHNVLALLDKHVSKKWIAQHLGLSLTTIDKIQNDWTSGKLMKATEFRGLRKRFRNAVKTANIDDHNTDYLNEDGTIPSSRPSPDLPESSAGEPAPPAQDPE